MDEFDRAILQTLQSNGRIANTSLAERVHLSESACLRRVRRLEESGLIRGYACVLDQEAAGFPDDVFVRVSLHSQRREDLRAFEDAALEIDEVVECYLMSGDADYLLHVVASGRQDYERIHSESLTMLPGVHRIESSFALRTVVKKGRLPLRP